MPPINQELHFTRHQICLCPITSLPSSRTGRLTGGQHHRHGHQVPLILMDRRNSCSNKNRFNKRDRNYVKGKNQGSKYSLMLPKRSLGQCVRNRLKHAHLCTRAHTPVHTRTRQHTVHTCTRTLTSTLNSSPAALSAARTHRGTPCPGGTAPPQP